MKYWHAPLNYQKFMIINKPLSYETKWLISNEHSKIIFEKYKFKYTKNRDIFISKLYRTGFACIINEIILKPASSTFSPVFNLKYI